MTERRRLPRWRDQRRSRVLALTLIHVGFVVLAGWNLARGGDFDFYAAAARSMSESWRALAFGAFDPAATVTLDKLSGFAVPQAASVALFGMTTPALALPQLVEGAITVWTVSLLGLRWSGPRVGLLAAAAAASTPIFVSMFGHPMEDGLLTMSLALALLWWQRALLTHRVWPTLMAGLFVGVGFQAKMLQAWLILPALAIAALFALEPWRRRLAGCLVVITSTGVASLAWATAIALVPPGGRPYIDGSLDDNVFAMIFGYNGIDRVVPGAVPGAVGAVGAPNGGRVTAVAHALGAVFAHAPRSPTAGIGKLLAPEYTTQIGWLYPAAIAGAVLVVVRWWPGRDGGRLARTSFALGVALVVWLVTAAAVLSVIRLPHTAYLAAIGVQLSLLAAFGWWELVRLTRIGHGAGRFALPLVVAVQTGWALTLAAQGAEPWPLAVAAAAVLLLGTAAAIASAARGRRTIARPALSILLASSLVAGQAFFSVQVLDAARDGSGGDASVGLRLPAAVQSGAPFRISAPAVWGGHYALPTRLAALVRLARAEGGGADGRPLMLTDSWALSAAVIVRTGDSVLTDGGYSGTVPVFTADAIRRMIESGRLRVLVVSGAARPADAVRAVAASPGCRRVRVFGDAVARSDHRRPAPALLYRCGSSVSGGDAG